MFDLTMEGTPLHNFAEEHREELQNTALLLGGRPWLRQTQSWLEGLQKNSFPDRRTFTDAKRIHELLTLEHVHETDRPEAGYFAMLDPAMPYVDEICLLSDKLADAFSETFELQITSTPKLEGGWS